MDGSLIHPVRAAGEHLGAVVAQGTVMKANTECIYIGWDVGPEFGGGRCAFNCVICVEHPGPADGADGAGGCEGLRAILGEVDPRFVEDFPRNAGGGHRVGDDLLGSIRGAGIVNAVMGDEGDGRFEGTGNTMGLVFHNHSETNIGSDIGPGLFRDR